MERGGHDLRAHLLDVPQLLSWSDGQVDWLSWPSRPTQGLGVGGLHIVDDVALNGRLAQKFQPHNWRPVLSQKSVVSPIVAGNVPSRFDPCWQTNCARA